MLKPGYKRQWKCQYCQRVWESITNILGKHCPHCGRPFVKATMARPSTITLGHIQDPVLNLGKTLLLEAQA